jgi:hypothetical protein
MNDVILALARLCNFIAGIVSLSSLGMQHYETIERLRRELSEALDAYKLQR